MLWLWLFGVRTDQMSGPRSMFFWKSLGVRRGAQHFLQIQTVLCVCMCAFFEGGGCWKGEGGAFEFNRTPIAQCLSRVLAFCLLSVLFCALPLHHPSPPQPPPLTLSLFCVSGGWWVCLFVWIQSDTASPPAYRHTDSEITSQWQRLRERGGWGGGARRDRCTDRAVVAVGGWVSLTHQSLATRREASLL